MGLLRVKAWTPITELYYITGGSARGKKVSQKTWRLLRQRVNSCSILMVITTDQPRSTASDDVHRPPGFLIFYCMFTVLTPCLADFEVNIRSHCICTVLHTAIHCKETLTSLSGKIFSIFFYFSGHYAVNISVSLMKILFLVSCRIFLASFKNLCCILHCDCLYTFIQIDGIKFILSIRVRSRVRKLEGQRNKSYTQGLGVFKAVCINCNIVSETRVTR